MNFTIDVGLILQAVTIVGIIWVIKTVVSIQAGMGKQSVWMKGHDKQDDERHTETKSQLESIWETIQKGR